MLVDLRARTERLLEMIISPRVLTVIGMRPDIAVVDCDPQRAAEGTFHAIGSLRKEVAGVVRMKTCGSVCKPNYRSYLLGDTLVCSSNWSIRAGCVVKDARSLDRE